MVLHWMSKEAFNLRATTFYQILGPPRKSKDKKGTFPLASPHHFSSSIKPRCIFDNRLMLYGRASSYGFDDTIK